VTASFTPSVADIVRLGIRLREVERRLRAFEAIRFESSSNRPNPMIDAILVLAREDGGDWNVRMMFAKLQAEYPKALDGYSRPERTLRRYVERLVERGYLLRVLPGWFRSAAGRPPLWRRTRLDRLYASW